MSSRCGILVTLGGSVYSNTSFIDHACNRVQLIRQRFFARPVMQRMHGLHPLSGERFATPMNSVLGTGVFNSDGDMWKYVQRHNDYAQCLMFLLLGSIAP